MMEIHRLFTLGNPQRAGGTRKKKKELFNIGTEYTRIFIIIYTHPKRLSLSLSPFLSFSDLAEKSLNIYRHLL